MPVKGNQPGLGAAIQQLLERASAGTKGPALGKQRVQALGDQLGWPARRTAQTHEVGHGRLERRRICVVTVPAALEWLAWPGRQQVFALQRETRFKKSGQRRCETVYGITSLNEHQADAATLLKMVRAHWQIENGLHWVRDVTFEEDHNRARSGHLPQVLAAVRNTAISLLRRNGATNIAAACRACAAQPWTALNLIGIQRTE